MTPNAAISYNVGNGGPTLDQRSVVDNGFLEYVRLGILPASDPVVANSLKVTDATIEKQTASGPGWLRYNGDGYGDCQVGAGTSCSTEGAPWTNGGANTGTGHPVACARCGARAAVSGDRADDGCGQRAGDDQ